MVRYSSENKSVTENSTSICSVGRSTECLLLKRVPERGTDKHRVLAHLLHCFKQLMQCKANIFHVWRTRGCRFVIWAAQSPKITQIKAKGWAEGTWGIPAAGTQPTPSVSSISLHPTSSQRIVHHLGILLSNRNCPEGHWTAHIPVHTGVVTVPSKMWDLVFSLTPSLSQANEHECCFPVRCTPAGGSFMIYWQEGKQTKYNF